ncbi:MAG: SET domain-containing protein-lysine N-methyltransferase [Gammaproteobacteria bacterium]|nr:SET domain-containing protein-lysine N-methyltransferase [Gammaproteobacteria bacterium]
MRPRAPDQADARSAAIADRGACEVRNVGADEYGVFATRRFAAKALVIAGEVAEVLEKPTAGCHQVGEHIFVTHRGNTDKVRHCCDPNVGIRASGDGAHDFYARRAIMPGEEITVDFALCRYTTATPRQRCRCGAANCRGQITGWKDLPAAQKAEYRDCAPSYLLALDDKYAR